MSLLITLGLGDEFVGGETPYMDLPVPVVSLTAGPLYATDVNGCFFLIDSHDHTYGKGKSIPVPGGVTVVADWNFGTFSITNLTATQYDIQSVVLPDTVVGAVYFKGVDLYANDGNGVAIQITEGGAVNVAAGKGFSGDFGMPGVPATVPYTAASHTFDFFENPASGGTWAILGISKLELHTDGVAGSAAVTIEVPALASSFTWTLPNAEWTTASSNTLLTISDTGQLGYAGLPPTTPASIPWLLAMTDTGVVSWVGLDPADGNPIVIGGGLLTILEASITPYYLGNTIQTNTGAGASGNLNTHGTLNDPTTAAALPNTPSLVVQSPHNSRPIYYAIDLFDFAASVSGGSDTIRLWLKIVRAGAGGTTYLPLLTSIDDGQGQSSYGGAQEQPFGAFFLLSINAGLTTLSLVYTADTTTDSTNFSTTAVTLTAWTA